MEKQKEYYTAIENDAHILSIVDNYFKNLAIENGAVEYIIPAMIDEDVLIKCGYFASFPQQLTVAGYVKPEEQEQVAHNPDPKTIKMVSSKMYFTPSACLHIYPMLENENITTKVVTTKARVFRYENESYDGMTRLWDFSVREIVFAGNSDFVAASLEDFKDKAISFCEKIGLPAEIVLANDHFYPTKRNLVKQKIQRSNALKYELIVKVEDKMVSIASFNQHGTHFSKPFHFDQNSRIVTGCVGFGLERLLAAIKFYNINLEDVK